jgi:hypothetical protein
MYSCLPSIGVDDPDELRSGFQPIGDLIAYFARSIVGREHLDREIGRKPRKASRHRVRNPFVTDERHVRSAYSVRVCEENEPCFGGDQATYWICAQKVADVESDSHRDIAMSKTCWLTNDHLAPNEFGPLVGRLEPHQVVRGEQCGGRHGPSITPNLFHAEQNPIGASTARHDNIRLAAARSRLLLINE